MNQNDAKGFAAPDVVLWFGGEVTSQPLADYLNDAAVHLVRISGDGVWSDPNHRAELVVEADPTVFCNALADWWAQNLRRSIDMGWLQRLREADSAVRAVVTADDDGVFDGLVVRDVVAALPEDAGLFVANSLPVRNLDQFGLARDTALRVFCNRGASGIDGTISCALGAAAARPDAPLVLVSGDLAFYHDLNGLLAAKRNHIPAIFVVINNNGGGIFHRLPIARYDPPFTELFETPHDLTYEHAAALFGIGYARAEDGAAFRTALNAALAQWQDGESSLIEVFTESENDLARRSAIIAAVAEQLRSTSTEH